MHRSGVHSFIQQYCILITFQVLCPMRYSSEQDKQDPCFQSFHSSRKERQQTTWDNDKYLEDKLSRGTTDSKSKDSKKSDRRTKIRLTGRKQPCGNLEKTVPDRGNSKLKGPKRLEHAWHVQETEMPGNSLAVQWIGAAHFHCRSPGSIPGFRELRTWCHTSWPKKKEMPECPEYKYSFFERFCKAYWVWVFKYMKREFKCPLGVEWGKLYYIYYNIYSRILYRNFKEQTIEIILIN